MASYCPKCNYKLSLLDVKPECPVCGVNLMYYGMRERLKEEADKAEYEHAMLQPRLDRLKGVNVGSPLAIVRLVITILPLVMTLIPFGSVTKSLPFFHHTTTVNVVSAVTDGLMKFDPGYYLDMIADSLFGAAYLARLCAMLFFVLALLFALINIFNLVAAGGPRGIRRNVTIASVGLACTVAASVSYAVSIARFNAAVPEVYQGKFLIWGVLATALAFAAVIAINLIYKKKGRPVKYTDVSQLLVSYDERVTTEKTESEA